MDRSSPKFFISSLVLVVYFAQISSVKQCYSNSDCGFPPICNKIRNSCVSLDWIKSINCSNHSDCFVLPCINNKCKLDWSTITSGNFTKVFQLVKEADKWILLLIAFFLALILIQICCCLCSLFCCGGAGFLCCSPFCKRNRSDETQIFLPPSSGGQMYVIE